MKIDIYPHFLPLKYKEALLKKANQNFYSAKWDQVFDGTPGLYDVDNRLRMLDRHEGLAQVLTLSSPAVEKIADPETAVYLSKLANDGLAELVTNYPDRFVAAAACLPMNNIDAALDETDRAIKDLKLKGVQIYTPVNGKPLDLPKFMPLYEKMASYDLPIWIHPTKDATIPDYVNESFSKYSIFQLFGWPFETTAAMTRLVFSGIFEKYPGVKFLTHHCGGMVPYFDHRIITAKEFTEVNLKGNLGSDLKRHPIDYYRMFYTDTANAGTTPGLMCAYAFFGVERMLFGTDAPYDGGDGDPSTRSIMKSIELMDIGQQEKEMIFAGNAKKLLRLGNELT